MGWRDVLGYTSECDTQNTQNTQNPDPNPSFGGSGGFGERDSMSTPAPVTTTAEALTQAARAADLDPATVEALLSPEDRADLDAGLLTADELRAYAQSVSDRWARGWVLPDEHDIAEAWLRQETERKP